MYKCNYTYTYLLNALVSTYMYVTISLSTLSDIHIVSYIFVTLLVYRSDLV